MGRRSRTYTLPILRFDATPIVDDFYRIQSVVLDFYLYPPCQAQLQLGVNAVRRKSREHAPIMVAPASKLFSTSSLMAFSSERMT